MTWSLTPEAREALLPRREVDERLLQRARRPGRVRGIATELWQAVLDAPDRAEGTLRRGLREARALHSRERRFVADTLYDLCRARGLLPAVSGPGAEAQLEAWLDHLEGGGRLREALDDAVRRADADAVFGVPEGGDRFVASLGDGLGPFLAASAGRAPVVVRVDARRARRDATVTRLASAGVEATASPWARSAIRLPPRTHLPGLPADLRAVLDVQDEGSQAVVDLLDPQPGERILDACAGAGGKTLAIGERLGGQGALHATDVRGRALDALRQRARRGRVRVAAALADDLSWPPEPAFDAVLVDAPCTGSGTWRRHPERRAQLARRQALAAVQAQVLADAAARVRPGGRLVYATCSVLDDENQAVVGAFLEAHPGWRAEPASEAVAAGAARDPWLVLTPHDHGADGFFAARLRAPD